MEFLISVKGFIFEDGRYVRDRINLENVEVEKFVGRPPSNIYHYVFGEVKANLNHYAFVSVLVGRAIQERVPYASFRFVRVSNPVGIWPYRVVSSDRRVFQVLRFDYDNPLMIEPIEYGGYEIGWVNLECPFEASQGWDRDWRHRKYFVS